jgi:RNA polymerase sigma-70 factor (ECF subfamily)
MDMALDQTTQVSDDALLALYANGDPLAAAELTQRLAPRLLSFANRMLRDLADAEDVVQDTMLRLWNIAPKWVPGAAKPSTWAFRVASNLCTDRLRKRRGVGLDEIAEPISDAPDMETQLMQTERATALDDALQTLPDRQRQAVVLRHIEGLSNPDIAEILEISTQAVESLTARGKRALATALASRKEELGL